MKTLIFCLVSLILVAGCGTTTKLNEEAKSVIVSSDKPAAGCKEVGSASSTTFGPFYQNTMRNKLMNEAAALGGNYVRLDSNESGGSTMTGTVFKCP